MALILRQAYEGATIGEVCRKAGISEVTFYVWRKKYVGLIPPEMKRLKLLEGAPADTLRLGETGIVERQGVTAQPRRRSASLDRTEMEASEDSAPEPRRGAFDTTRCIGEAVLPIFRLQKGAVEIDEGALLGQNQGWRHRQG